MDFGNVRSLDRVRFDLGPDLPRSLATLGRSKPAEAESVKLYLGCPIWSQKEWVGRVYPPRTKPADFLYHYSRQFNSIELNVTHYRMPDSALIESWREVVPRGFKFCPKWPQMISHDHMLRDSEALIREFCEHTVKLEDNLGLSFLQLPPGFAPQHLGLLDAFLKRLPKGYPVSVEFRHASWFKNGSLIDAALDVLESHRAGTVITDTAGRRDASHASVTDHRLMVRFLGNALHPSDFYRLDDWAERLKRWISAGLNEIYFFLHEPDNILAPDLAASATAKFNNILNLSLKTWTPQHNDPEAESGQMSLF